MAEAQDDNSDALGLVHELVELTRGRSDRYRSLFLPELTRTCVATDALDLAHELAEGLTVDLGRIGCARTDATAVLAEAEGRVAEALDLYRQAETRWQAFGSVPGRAEALLGQGRCLISLGQRGAEEPLAAGRELFASMSYQAGLAGVDKLLT